jgi:two-component system, LytTR family, sensor histidine kinase AlgZ
MHPILANIRRLGLYLLAWIPLAALVVYLIHVAAGIEWRLAAAFGAPLSLIEAFVCLSAWYVCRFTPLQAHRAGRVVATHVTGAAVSSGLFLGIAWGLGWILAKTIVPVFVLLVPTLQNRRWQITGLLFGLGVLFYWLAVAVWYAQLALDARRQAEEREARSRIMAREAELRALKAQVNPHFLFNSLNSISALTTLDPPKAREMCVLLGDFLRRTLGLGEKSMITLREEISLVESYLRVEKVRFGKRLETQEELDPAALDGAVPPLLLQPLVENCVLHGVSNLPDGGWIRLTATSKEGALEIVVENQFDQESPPARRNGVGLENVRRRLQACYGAKARVSAVADGDCFRVSLTLPLERKVERA